MGTNSRTFAGIIYIVMGMLCLILRGDIILCAAFCVGIALAVFGIMELVGERVATGVVCLICGLVITLLGWLMVSLILYIIAISLVVIGIIKLTRLPERTAVNDAFFRPEIVRPVLMILCGVLLFINQGAAVSAIFIVVGILLIVAGIFALIENKYY